MPMIKVENDYVRKNNNGAKPEPNDWGALHRAVSRGNIARVHALCDDPIEFYSRDTHGRSALHIAIRSNNFFVAEVLIGKGADVNAQDVKGETPLHMAVRKKDLNLLKLLLNSGADSLLKNDFGETPQRLAKNDKNPAFHELLCLHNDTRKTDLFDQKNYRIMAKFSRFYR